MDYKWIGAGLITLTCGCFGILAARNHRREASSLEQMIHVINFMEAQLQYHLTPLPDLIRLAAGQAEGQLQQFFLSLSGELAAQVSPEVSGCVHAVLSQYPQLPIHTREIILQLSRTLGCFDLPGQLQGLAHTRQNCRITLDNLRMNQPERLRSYQTLGFCAGASIAVLFL